MIYLDWAATAPPDRDILSQIDKTTCKYMGNPSSIHTEGLKAHDFLQENRREIARYIGCEPDEIIFTSGGTEANNMIICSLIHHILRRAKEKPHLIISGIEHASAWEPAKSLKHWGAELTIIHAENDGRIKPEKIEEALKDNTRLVTVMLVNNETGAIQPIKEIGRIINKYKKKSQGFTSIQMLSRPWGRYPLT
jgi:cysteine desulfurase